MKKYKLPKEFAEKWVAALRSGEYKQGRDMLLSKKCEYCCLGVAGKLCDVPDELMLEISELRDIDIYDSSEDSYYNVMEVYNAPKEIVVNGDLVREVTILNDNDKLSFPEIADWITENVAFTTP